MLMASYPASVGAAWMLKVQGGEGGRGHSDIE